MAKSKKGLMPDGRYRAVKTIGGKKKQFYSTVSYSDALKQADNALEDYNQKHSAPNFKDITLAEWLDEWLTSKNGVIEDDSLKRHEQNCRIHIIPQLGELKLTDITGPHILAFMNNRKNAVVCRKKNPTPEDLEKAKKISIRSLNYIYVTLNAAIEKARVLKMIPENPCEQADKPIVKRKLPLPLTPEEVTKYLTQIAQHPILYPISIVALDSGCRNGELVNLKWANVSFITNSIQITKGKTENSTRNIPLPSRSMKLLRAHKKSQEKHIKEYGIRYKNNDLVFPDEHGQPIPNHAISKMFKRASKRAGLRDNAKFHNLRDTHATELLSLGEHPFNVQERLGHATLQMTKDYSKVTPQHHKNMIKKLDQKRDQSVQKVFKRQRTIKKISLRETPEA